MPTIGEKIRAVRQQLGISQTDLGQGLVTPSMISQIEAGKAKPSATLLTAIASRLGMPVEYFFGSGDAQSTREAQMRLAKYHLLRHEPQEAINLLEAIDLNDSPIPVRNQTQLLLAVAYRQQERYFEATSLLDEVRELALRTNDECTLLSVGLHSGHVEYAMGNWLGAIQEWRKALKEGELLSSQPSAAEFLNAKMMELCFMLSEVHLKLGEPEPAMQYLQQAAEVGRQFGRFRDSAASLFVASRQALSETDVATSKHLVERAIAIIESARWLQQYILVQLKLENPSPTSEAALEVSAAAEASKAISAAANGTETAATRSMAMAAKQSSQSTAVRTAEGAEQAQTVTRSQRMNVQREIATAVASVDVDGYVEAELVQVEQELHGGDPALAYEAIERCWQLLNEARNEEGSSSVQSTYYYRLLITAARIERAMSNRAKSIEIVESVAEELMQKGREQMLIRVWALLIQWYSEDGETQKVLELSEALQSLIGKLYGHGVCP